MLVSLAPVTVRRVEFAQHSPVVKACVTNDVVDVALNKLTAHTEAPRLLICENAPVLRLQAALEKRFLQHCIDQRPLSRVGLA